MANFFASIPKFLLGPLVVILGILYFIYDDPPRTICDTQFEIFKKETEKYLYGYKRKNIQMSPEWPRDVAFCQGITVGSEIDAVSKEMLKPTIPAPIDPKAPPAGPKKFVVPGSCFDFLEGIRKTLHVSRHIPDQCAEPQMSGLVKFKRFTGQEDPIGPLKTWMTQSLYTFSYVSWNDTPIVRRGLYNWLDSDDLIVFCRLKAEYTRLMGLPAYTKLQSDLLMSLSKAKNMKVNDVWPRTVLSHECRIL